MSNNIKIPMWIKIYSGVLILTAIIGTYSGYVDPYVFFPDFRDFGINMSELPMSFLNGLWGTRNLAGLIVLLVGLLAKRPQVVMAVFAFRFLVELQDIAILATFYNPLGTPVWAYVVGTVLFIIPEGLGTWTLWKLTSRQIDN